MLPVEGPPDPNPPIQSDGHEETDTGQGLDGGHPLQPATKLESPSPSQAESPVFVTDAELISEAPATCVDRRNENVEVILPESTLVHPKSQYEGYIPPFPPTKERDAVSALSEILGPHAQEDFVEFELNQFSFYVNTALYPYELRPLQHLATRMGHDRFYFDGILSVGGIQHYVEKVEVSELPIGNYLVAHPTTQGQIWVRSRLNSKRKIYYRLNKPAVEYARFHTPFVWVADLAKHVVDFSAFMIDQGRQVSLSSFGACFIQWLAEPHRQSQEIQLWRRRHPSDDYRTSVAANIDFIWKELNGVLKGRKAWSLQLFRETIHFNQYKQTASTSLRPVVQGNEEAPPTIVTQYVKDCFGHMVIGKILKVVGDTRLGTQSQRPLNGAVEKPKMRLDRHLSSKRSRTSKACFLPLDVIDRVKAGDTISTPRDEDTTDTKWRNMASKGATEDGRWFSLVQKVHIGKDGSRSFDVTWFYRPVETPCCMMRYPWANELFLSDHCTCEEGRQSRVKDHEIIGVHDIDWFGSPDESHGEFFVRQTYIIESRRWVTLQKAHMVCSHGSEKPGFRAGDTVLAVLEKSQSYAELYEVIKVFRQGDNMFVRLRRLLRRNQIDPQAGAAPNELVYTDQLVVAKPDRVIGKCAIRFFRPEESIPTPYDRKGTGNLFYITHRLDGEDRCVPLGEFPTSLRQGFDPTRQTFRKLRGMDLFCGSGNFGRGLEEGGAVEMKWANDIWDRAIHTYMANSPESNSAKPFLGSVDDLLQLALEGKFADNVPRPGDVDFISAGSPCPGFSLLTQDKTTLAQIKNQSLVASFASFVDFYRPKYGILENVPTIVQARRNRSEDVLSQLFCTIVGMGYQAQLILGDAWSHGAPQCRKRVFLYFAAPGLRLPEAPLLSHSHYSTVKAHDLGEMCNGEPFVSRSFQPAPFKFTSAAEATADLPLIGDGKPEPATAFPDHRICAGMTPKLRHQIAAIPTRPYGMSFATAWYGRLAGNSRLNRHGESHDGGGDPAHGSVMTAAERALFPDAAARVSRISNGWRRVRPGDVLQTVTTRCQPTDARASTGLHWIDPRPLTVLEIRRAQGFPDHEVLLGNLADQWKLAGNSVARQMALALGLRLREAWVGGMGEVGSGGGREGREGRGGSESASASVSVYGSGSVAASDLTADSDSGGQSTSSLRRSAFREPIDLTSTSRSTSATSGGMSRASTSTPASAITELAKAGGMRKRLLSQSLGPELEVRPAKVIRLDSGGSTPIPESKSGLGPERELENEQMEEEPGSVAPSSPDVEEGIATPVKTGPTIVRLLTLDEAESDGLGWDSEME